MNAVMGILIIGFVLFFGGYSGNKTIGVVDSLSESANGVAQKIKDVADQGADTVGKAKQMAANAGSALGQFFSKKLPNGMSLNIPQLGVENKLIDFITGSDDVNKETWFNFDRIQFETGSASLSSASEEQIQNISKILKAFPQVKLKIGGYTDNTGSPELNKKLSQKRADSVKAAIVNQGAAVEQIKTEGYGQQHPVASNDTEEGRAKNRRIAVRVSEK